MKCRFKLQHRYISWYIFKCSENHVHNPLLCDDDGVWTADTSVFWGHSAWAAEVPPYPKVQYRAGKEGWFVSRSRVQPGRIVHSPVHWVTLPIRERNVNRALATVISYFRHTTINYEIRILTPWGSVLREYELNPAPFYADR